MTAEAASLSPAWGAYRHDLFQFLSSLVGVRLLESDLDEIERLVSRHPTHVQAVKDALRMNWLEQQSDHSAWVARQSVTGRGFRLHNTGRGTEHWPGEQPSARAAIDTAMKGKP